MKKHLLIFTLLLLLAPLSLQAQTKIFCLGDSLTAGAGVDEYDAYPAVLQRTFDIESKGKVIIINGGISGSTTASGHGRLKFALKTKPDIVILALGANDGLRGQSLTAMKKNLERTIVKAKENNVTLVLAGMRIPPNYGEKYAKEFQQVFITLAKKHHLSFLPFLLKDVAGREHLNQADAIHPNPAGHKIIASNLYQHLKPLIP